jgi:outer membrane protein TolC
MRTSILLPLALIAAPALAQQPAAPPPPPPAAAPAPAAPIEAVSFDEAVARAARHATSATVAAQEVARTEALLVETRAGSLPLLSANGTYTRIDHQRTGQVVVLTGPNQDVPEYRTIQTAPQESNNENLSLTAPLLAPSRWYQWSHAADQLDLAKASERDVRRTVSLSAARAYLTIISQKRAIEVSRRAVNTAAAHFDYARTRRQGGVGNALDEARAEQLLATAQAQLESALAGLTRAQEALGIAAGASGPLDARAEPDLTGGPPTPDEGTQEAEQARTDVLLARRRAEAAHRVTRDSWADWMPTLNLNAQVYRQDPATSTVPSNGWQVQLVLSLPIFEGGLRVGQRQERSALEAEARAQLDGTLQQARSDVRVAYDNLRHNAAALDQSRLAADRAGTALTIVEEAFKAGATTSLDVIDAERTARDADSAAVVAEDAVRQSRLDLLAAVGKFP